MNSVVNNLFDQFGAIVKAMEPVVASAASISQTVVQETANAGFTYVMFGMVFLCLTAICGGLCCFADRITEDKDLRLFIHGWTLFGGIVFGLVGFLCVICNIQFWIAPTKTVILEVLNKIT
jgi:uncharacterized BrkB/YihY/UPF0761 family membrane protein